MRGQDYAKILLPYAVKSVDELTQQQAKEIIALLGQMPVVGDAFEG